MSLSHDHVVMGSYFLSYRCHTGPTSGSVSYSFPNQKPIRGPGSLPSLLTPSGSKTSGSPAKATAALGNSGPSQSRNSPCTLGFLCVGDVLHRGNPHCAPRCRLIEPDTVLYPLVSGRRLVNGWRAQAPSTDTLECLQNLSKLGLSHAILWFELPHPGL